MLGLYNLVAGGYCYSVLPLLQKYTHHHLNLLHFEGAKIGDEEASSLSTYLKSNTTLTTLDLQRNSIGDEGACTLGDSLKSNSTLTILNLKNNSIGDEGARALSDSLKSNSTLTELNISQNWYIEKLPMMMSLALSINLGNKH